MALPTRKPPSLRARALMWLAQRDHSRQELGDKLSRWLAARQRAEGAAGGDEGALEHAGLDSHGAPSEDDVERLLDALEQAGHLSDRRFVESRIHARAPRYGNLRIQQELRHLGARPDEATLAALRASEAERARAVWAARYGRLPADAAERARQMRFLAGRGFSAETIRRVLAHSGDDPAGDPTEGE